MRSHPPITALAGFRRPDIAISIERLRGASESRDTRVFSRRVSYRAFNDVTDISIRGICLIGRRGGAITDSMRKLLLLGLVGCWSSSPQLATQPAPPPERGASTGGATYGGASYGGLAALVGRGEVDGVVDDLSTGGGGGTGVGTIGVGKYGAAGHGQGGGGVGAGPPTVSIGAPGGSSEALDPAIIRRYIRRNIDKIQRCYEQELPGDPKLAGRVTVRFTIGADGRVIHVSAAGMPTVEECVAAVISTIQFPPPRGGGIVNVNYPFIFQQADPGPPPAP
jgi:hypothetical protein